MSRLDDLMSGNAESPSSVDGLRADLDLLDGHMRVRMERAVLAGGGPDESAWRKLRQAAERLVEADAQGNADALNSALATIVSSVREGAQEQAEWRELTSMMRLRVQLTQKLKSIEVTEFAGKAHKDSFAAKRKIEQIQELALHGFSQRAIGKAVGLSQRQVSRYLVRLRQRGSRAQIDVKAITSELRARFAADRRWLYEMRGVCRNAFDVTRFLEASRKIDGQEMELLRTLGILTVVASSLVDEAMVERSRGMTTEALELELAEKAQLLLERSTASGTRAIDG